MITRRRTQLLVAVIALQVLVPTVALLGDPPSRFGFQMFSGYEVGNTVVVHDGDGAEIPIEPAELWHVPLRAELDWAERLPAHICARVAGAHEVVVFQHAAGLRAIPCP